MKKLIAAAGIALGVLTTAVAYAETPKLIGSVDYISGTLHIDGQISSADKYVSANMLVLDKTPQDAESDTDIGSNIVYSGETITDENGVFTFDVKFDQALAEGTYDLYFGSEAFDRTEHYPVYFSSAETYKSNINELNGKKQYSDFKAWLDTDNGAEKIGFNKYQSLTTDKDTAVKMIYNYAITKGLSTEKSTENNAVFASGYYASLIKNNISPTNGWVDEILLKDSNIADLYNKYGDKNLTYFLQKINKESATAEDFEKNILDALILTVVKYPNGNDNIKTVFEKYSEYLGANTKSAAMAKYAAIAGNDYASVAACVQAFNASGASNNSSSGGGGGSSSSGGSGGGVFAGASANTTKALGIKFNDLNPVPWAYKAISVLYEKGIVSGKHEESFCPNDTVTREEFAKMLVCAAGLQDNAVTGNAFSDAASDAWYTKYINIAYDNGICSGIGDGAFGVGREVTREDMCVMVYNTLKKLSVNCPEAELKFNDKSDFSEYSKAAVASLADKSIVNGTGEGNFEPKGNATRAQAAVIICNMITNIN